MAFHSGIYTLSLLLTFSLLSPPRLPSIAPVPSPARLSPLGTAPPHPRTWSAKVLLFWCFPSLNPSWWQTRKGWKQIHGGGQRPVQRVHVALQHTSLQFHNNGTWPSPVWCTSLTSPCLSLSLWMVFGSHVFRKLTPLCAFKGWSVHIQAWHCCAARKYSKSPREEHLPTLASLPMNNGCRGVSPRSLSA